MVSVRPDWVEIPAGALHRGTPTDEIASVFERHADLAVELTYFTKESPRIVVQVDGFHISRVPVARREWNVFAAEADLPPAPVENPDFPIDEVEWWQAAAFCEWLSEETGDSIRLPTEMQWERAARGDDQREYPWGDEWDRRAANTAALGIGHYLPVGTLLRGASPFGVLDLAGNVDEWTRDVYAPYEGAPAGVAESETWALDPHVTRGGTFRQNRDLSRCARRHGVYDGYRGAGFRLVREF